MSLTWLVDFVAEIDRFEMRLEYLHMLSFEKKLRDEILTVFFRLRVDWID